MNEIVDGSKLRCVLENCRGFAKENGYCTKHQRKYKYDQGIKGGKNWCRFFFRGCDSELTSDKKTCEGCLSKKFDEKQLCAHEGCRFHVKEGFCGKHNRDVYRLEEKERGVRYCDIPRGCFTICKEGMSSCDACLETTRLTDKKRYVHRNTLNDSIKHANTSDTRLCVSCGKDYIKFLTKFNYESKRCKQCSETQQRQDDKRKERDRNYKEENLRFPQTYFKAYIKSSIRREIPFELTFEQFDTLIRSPCYYCTHHIDIEANGIDRVNNSLGYTIANCVPCCWECNRIKSFYHPVFFVEKCRIISTNKVALRDFFEQWMIYYSRSCNNSYGGYKHDAITRRHCTFDITKEQWDTLTRSPCYLCGYRQIEGIGLDRINNEERGYTVDNCRPCCGSCNTMKHEMSQGAFLDKCEDIARTWPVERVVKELVPIPPYGNPLKEIPYETKVRAYWKTKTLYFAALAGKEDDFLKEHSDILKEDEFREHIIHILLYPTAEKAEAYIKRFLNAMTQRRKRLPPNIK